MAESNSIFSLGTPQVRNHNHQPLVATMENSVSHVICVIFLLIFLAFFIYESHGVRQLFGWSRRTIGGVGALGDGLNDAVPARPLRSKLASYGSLMEQPDCEKLEWDADLSANMAASTLRGQSLG